MQVGGDFNIGFIAVRDHPLPTLLRFSRNLQDAGKSADFADVRLADVGPASVHHLDELPNVGQSKIAHAERQSVPRHSRVAFNIIERQGRFQEPDTRIPEHGKESQAFLSRVVRERGVDD